MSAREIAYAIASGKTATVKLTIPEGFTLRQIAERVGGTGLCTTEEFLTAAVPAAAGAAGIPGKPDSLEGYLFPATYVLDYGAPSEKIVAEFLRAFRERVVDGMADDLARSKRPLHEIVTIASLIEREARVEKDRPLISSVIYNRLRIGMKLQIDATVLYALGEHKDRVLYEDLRVDSPFNTYRNPGLPPHAIASPGEASLRAALNPAETDYLFYVAKPDGSHLFTRTYEEHLQAIETVREGR